MEQLPSLDKLLEASQAYDQIAPVMGFREYWYPICLTKEVTERGLEMTPLGFPILLLRRSGKIYAIANECPHRGTRLSLGSCQFPGTDTITCTYHGWTYDVTNGNCVAALTDGPDSPVINKVRVKTYPVTECKGIVWVWMGKEQPVAPEVDIPAGIRRASLTKVVRRHIYGNWRWHVENPGEGHASMLHRSSIYMRAKYFPGFFTGTTPALVNDMDGMWICETNGMPGMTDQFPGLGTWPRRRWTEGILQEGMTPMFGINGKVSMGLPAITRVIHFPIMDALYYEWFVQTDPEHYLYFQVCNGYPATAAERAWFLLRYYLWGRPAGMVQFNAQDAWMVAESHKFAQRHGAWNPPSRLYRADHFQASWRYFASKYARGVGSVGAEVRSGGEAARPQRPVPVAAKSAQAG